MVCGWRRRRHDSFSRVLPSRIANGLISWSTGVHLHDYGCSLKAIRAEVVKGLRLYGEMHRFIPAVASWMGVARDRDGGEPPPAHARAEQVRPGPHAARAARPVHGQVPARLRHAARALLRRLGLAFGAAGAGIAGLPRVHPALPGQAIWGPPPAPVRVSGSSRRARAGVLGLVAELLVRIYHESQGKPIYVVKEIARAERRARARAGPGPALSRPGPRILFLTESFWPVLGGGETHIRDLARRLVARGLRRARSLTRRTEAAWAASEDAGGVGILRVGPAGPGRAKQVPAWCSACCRPLCRLARRCDVLVVRGTRVLGPAGPAGRASWANRRWCCSPR